MADYNSSLTAQEIENTLLGAVVHNKRMLLSDAEKAQARENIGAGSADNSFVVLGYFATLEELEATITSPKAGPFYGVGEAEPFDFYSWDELHSVWVNNGNIKGLDGKDGKDGEDGKDGVGGGASVVVAPDAPEEPQTGDMWFDSDDDNVLPIDDVPTEGSTNLISSGAVFDALTGFSSGGVEMVKLWENDGPTSEMIGGTTIALALSNYNLVRIHFGYNTGSNTVYAALEIDMTLNASGYATATEPRSNGILAMERKVNVTTTGVTFGDCKQYFGTTYETSNKQLIPTAIYGIKTSSKPAGGGGAGVSLEKVYPVGAIYISAAATNPAELFGFGTWQQIKDKFLLAAGDSYAAGTTGGSSTNTHSHVQTIGYDGSNVFITVAGHSAASRTLSVDRGVITTASAKGIARQESTYSETIDTMPPYLTLYMWQRTA